MNDTFETVQAHHRSSLPVARPRPIPGSALPVLVRRLGIVPYAVSLAAMREYTGQRTAESTDQLWMLEHFPVFTLGQAGRREHLLRETSIEVVSTERGGQITYHGPGQVVAYLLLDLQRRGLKVREFVELLEEALIATLGRYNVVGERKSGAPGVYVRRAGELQKIAALGLKIRNGCCFHGVSLNVDMDLTPFSLINPCGYAGLRTVDLASLGLSLSIDQVSRDLAHSLLRVLGAQERSAYGP